MTTENPIQPQAQSEPQAPALRSGDLFGGLVLSGCKDHPHRTDLSCCKIRRPDGSALSVAETWAAIVQMGNYISALEEECDSIALQKAQHVAGLSSPNDGSEPRSLEKPTTPRA